jgi:penicillin amidase
MQAVKRWTKRVLGLLLLVVLLVAALLLWYRQASLPQLDGSIRLPAQSGLSAAVQVVRDADAVPHIEAHSAEDAYFALGFVHAQDRLWQLEMNRRIAAGRVAEILGPGALPTDRFLRTLGVRRNAERIYQHLSPEAQAALQAYSKGINAYLAQRHGPLPPEFILTGAPAPEAWQPADSLGWQTMMAWDLGANWTQELLRMRLAQKLSVAQINQFIPPYPGEKPLPTQDYTQLYRPLAGTSSQLASVAAIAPPSYVEGMGSNNWVVGGALSENGKPLLANDPHLGLSAPALWYFAHLSAPGLNVIGATLPGLPLVVLGHNDRVAWGFTNTGPDVQDLYIEKINPDNPAQYRTPDGWADFAVRTETIKVKGQADESLQVRETRHGPVITGAVALADKAPMDAKQHVIAFAWTALQPDDLTFQAGLKLNRARDWNSFLDGARDFMAPQQNFVYADVDGNIGYVAPGRIPVRKPENDLHGLAPAPGWDARYDWDGYIPFEELPRSFNPPAQKIATANQKVVPDDYPYFLTSEWAPPYRYDRIQALLAARKLHNLDSFAAIQKDKVSLAAQELLPLLRGVQPKSEREKHALALLAQWDGSMDAARPEALIFNAWMRTASKLIFEDVLGKDLMQDYWELRNMQAPLVAALKGNGGEEGRTPWCSGVARGQPHSCAPLLSQALAQSLDQLEQSYGRALDHWQWGQAHMARSEHRPFGKVALLSPWFDIRVPSDGDSFTVNVGRYNLRDQADPFASRHAPSLRALYDLGKLENSRFMYSSGQSGNIFSPYYRNLAQRWAAVEYLPMRTERAAIEKGSIGTLKLQT